MADLPEEHELLNADPGPRHRGETVPHVTVTDTVWLCQGMKVVAARMAARAVNRPTAPAPPA